MARAVAVGGLERSEGRRPVREADGDHARRDPGMNGLEAVLDRVKVLPHVTRLHQRGLKVVGPRLIGADKARRVTSAAVSQEV